MAKPTKIVDATKYLKLLKKDMELKAVPVIDFNMRKHLEIDTEEMGFEEFLELIRAKGEKCVYYILEPVFPEDYVPVDFEELMERANEIYEWEGPEDEADYRAFLMEYCDRYNEAVAKVEEQELFVIDFIAKVEGTYLVYPIGLVYDKYDVIPTDQFLENLDYMFFNGLLYEDEEECCGGEDCECGGHHHGHHHHHHHHHCDCDCEDHEE